MDEKLGSKILGTWIFKSWTYKNEMGEEIDYFGKDAYGILMYDKFGWMNAQILQKNRQYFSSDSINEGSPEEICHAYKTYLAYFGRYSEIEPGVIVHKVEGSLFPNWLNQTQVRYGKLHENEHLIIYTPPVPVGNIEIVFKVTWEREREKKL